MRRFRTHWLALFGALTVLTFSLSTAFAARPAVDADDSSNFGQQVSTFVHVLLSGTSDDDEADEGDSDACEPADGDSGGDEDGTGDEDTGDEDTDESAGETVDETSGDCDEGSDEDTDTDTDAEDEDSGDEDSADSDAQNHGQCVAEVAQSDAVGENDTHGWAVVLAAQITCWLEEQPDESADGAEDEGDTGDADSTEASTQSHGKSDAAHQRKLDRGSGKPSWLSTATHGGHGKGHGHSF